MVYLCTTLQEYKIQENCKVQLEISNMIINIIEQNSPYRWLPDCKPFVNRYNGKISYDKSGEVYRMSREDLKKIIVKIERSQLDTCIFSPLQTLLEEIKIDKWIATYRPNCGKHWVSYNDILKSKFEYWKYNNLQADNIGCHKDEKFADDLDNIFLDFIENASYKFYSAKLLMEIKK